MIRKDIAFTEPWREAYREVQQQINALVRQTLATNNGCITAPDYACCFEKYPRITQQKLFDVTPLGLEWKNKVQSIEKVATILKCMPADIPLEIRALFYGSRKIFTRRQFPHLVPTTAKRFIRQEAYGQVYGFSLLIRPRTLFQGGVVPREEITFSKNKLIVFLHADLPLRDSVDTMFLRVMFFNDKNQPVRFSNLEAKLSVLKQDIVAPLRANDSAAFVGALVRVVNAYIHERQPMFHEDNLSSHFFDRDSIIDQFE